MKSKLAVLTTIAALALSPALAACGGGQPTAGSPASTSKAPPSTSSPGTSTSATPSLSPTPPATATPPSPLPTPPPAKPTKPAPTAANGTNYKSCSDGRCEVAVRTGTRLPVKASLLGFTSTLKIDRVSDGTVAYSAKGGCCSISTSAQAPGGSYVLNNLKVLTIAVSGKTAVLRLSPA